jgi:adenosylcobinamide-phosphate synthase
MTLLLLAVLLDLALGDPPNRWHPVAWIGRLLAAGRRMAPTGGPGRLFLHGATLVILTAGAAAGAAALIASGGGSWLALLLQAWALKCTFALRGLFGAASTVGASLARSDLDAARDRLACHLVSRPTAELDAGEVASATIESLAENLTDSWIAPVFFFLLGGLPVAWAYRVVNTADAMIGYRDGELEYLGKCAARLDDVLNFVPARLATLSLIAAAGLAGQSTSGAWRTVRRDGARTASPNAGLAMAAMAGALGVRLSKRGHYTLGAGPAPDLEAIGRAMRVSAWAAALWLLGTAGAGWALRGLT